MKFITTLSMCVLVFLLPSVSNAQNPLTEQEYNELFPYRFGTESAPDGGYVFNPANDFYTYASFLEAIERMKNIKVYMERREGTNLYKVTREDKTTGVTKVIRTDAGFDDSWNSQKSIIMKEVDYAMFLAEGTQEQRRRELSAFLANISQETTGGWATAPGGKYAWGLYFREEVSYAGTDLIGYVEQNHPDYPAVPGKSYHGRGPIQLSWNYNYGQVSQFLYGDKNVLLANPERVIEDGALAFQTAIWFWMTPQYPKPSAHDVMVGNWEPTSYDLENNRFPGFGVTVNIINGGLECGSGTEKAKVLSRIGHYERHSSILNVTTDLDGQSTCNTCGCANQRAFGGNEPEPTPKQPRISLLSPTSNEVRMETFSAISIEASVLDKEDQAIENVSIAVDGTVLSTTGTTASFTPSAYGVLTITVVAEDRFGEQSTLNYAIEIIDPKVNCGTAWEAKVYVTGDEVVYEGIVYSAGWETKETDIPGSSNVWKIKATCPGYTFDCTGAEEWSASKTYQTNGMKVVYNNQIYTFQKWWSTGNQPDQDPSTWQLLGTCSGGGEVDNPPVVNFISPANNTTYTSLSAVNIQVEGTDDKGALTWSITANDQEVSTAPQFTFTPTAFGQYTITAIATDSKGQSTSKSIQLLFKEETTENQLPTVTIVVDSNIEQETLSPVSVSIVANDTDGQVTSIVSTVDGATFNQSTFNFTPSSFGNHTISTTVTDNEGGQASASVTITVTQKTTGGDCNGVEEYTAYPSIYQSGDVVSYQGKLYESVVNNLYNVTPGTADHWWKPIGECGASNARKITIGSSLQDDIKIYPNPVVNRLHVQLIQNTTYQVALFNGNGQKILSLEDQQSKLDIDFSTMEKGMYYLLLESSEGKKTWKKLIK
ncbi:glycoside hydrolase family 19 protein [Flammeovirga aprica]|uniref:T9SS type A sorting domain-containing protein n=1 Tax=Flammeovirga aprica JL-4 TaxID=694437 RepID=A0A7X9P3M9_9BACT|nr:glycoside hydrolase family 19 protein [Flammeovirga aprica]NME68683.1 T9SS type A sorting domain-containing protein [Flammeovirga aprica JL-4]